MSLTQNLEAEDLGGKHHVPPVHVGDTVEVHYLIREGEKERIQLFLGTVLAIQGRGISRAMLVRRIVQGEGVERLFPLHSPRVKDIKITRRGDVKQARLYYLRDRVGKRTRVDELLGEKVRREKEREADSLKAADDAKAAKASAATSGEETPDAEAEAVEV